VRAMDASLKRDAALAAIAEAQRLIGQADQRPARQDELKSGKNNTLGPSIAACKPVDQSVKKAPHSWFLSRKLVGLIVLMCICGAALAWQSSNGQVASELIPTSSVPIRKIEEAPARSALNPNVANTSKVAFPEPQAQVPLQAVPIAPTATPELAQQVQLVTRVEVTSLQSEIDQLKAEQSRTIHQNLELTEQLKATQEIARHDADLIEDLRATQAQMARDSHDLAGQLKATQDLMAGMAERLKESQEQVARLVASERKPRPRTPASPPLITANSTRQTLPAPPPPPPKRSQTRAPSPLQPKPE
jgi:hypothetical protein